MKTTAMQSGKTFPSALKGPPPLKRVDTGSTNMSLYQTTRHPITEDTNSSQLIQIYYQH
jgi:hypothetical protein